MEHAICDFWMDAARGEPIEDHGDGLLDGLGIAEGMNNVGAEAGPGGEGTHAGAAGLLMEMAEGAGGERGRAATAAVGLDVSADMIFGITVVHFESSFQA